MNFVPLKGSDHQYVPGSFIVARANPSRRIAVTVRVRSRGSGLDALVHEMASRKPKERPYFSREAFGAAHGAHPDDVQKVAQYARRHGLSVVPNRAARRTGSSGLAHRAVELRGTVAAFSRAFHVELFIFRSPQGLHRGYTGPLQIPETLEGVVEGIFGLDTRPQARPHFRISPIPPVDWVRTGTVSYTPNQVAKLYNYPSGVNGQGECVGIIELGGGYRMADLVQYMQQLGLPTPNISSVSVAGATNAPTGNPNSADAEVMLDIEVVACVAPGAQIVVYFAPNTNRGFLKAITTAVHDNVNKPSVISISWGGPEASWTAQAMNAFTQAFQAASALGITVCCASGDSGSSDGVRPFRRGNVDFPASSPFALGCGGTRLESDGNAITSEVVWNDGMSGGAGGGGISGFFQTVPPYQSNANIPPSVNPGGGVGRGVPDVAGDADPQTGYRIRVDGLTTPIGGTSAVAPLYAGLFALINQSLGAPVGFVNPALYAHMSSQGVFRDIVQGNNDISGLVGGYNAGPGWDACTGLGSVNGTALLGALRGSS